ncbi:MAG: PD-(D/E)XK nuclease family protein [Desulfobacterales bacterium]|nr:PD-(D/E)XK nuclease family protein [Desulfobacterales bacterium]
MTKNEALQDLKKELHVSHSQIFTYLNCSLKYRFMYVEARPPERVSIALPFGKSIHASLERQYRVMKESQRWEPLGVLLNYFEHHINLELDQTDVPIVYKKETPDRDAVIDMGNAMLEAFHEGVNLSGFEILEIERPLSARLYTDEGQPTDLKLIGVLDLVLKDEAGRIIAVDNKTAAKPYAQATVDDDNQLTCYAYLLAANRYVFPTADVHCRFDVLRKLKSPKLEQYHTVRTADQRRRFAKLATAVLAAIDQKVFFPQPSWMCSDCAYQDACRSW